MDFRVNPKDNCFPGMILPAEQQNTASAALESISQDFLDESSSILERFPMWSILNKLLTESGGIASPSIMLSTVTDAHICLLWTVKMSLRSLLAHLNITRSHLFLPSEVPHHTSYSPFSKLPFCCFLLQYSMECVIVTYNTYSKHYRQPSCFYFHLRQHSAVCIDLVKKDASSSLFSAVILFLT